MNVFPAFLGLAWPVVKRPILNTVIHQSVSGREYRTGLYQYPLYEFDLTFDYLSQTDVKTLAGFYLEQLGPLQPFLFDSQNDDVATNETFGVGNGTQTVFTLTRSNGGLFSEPIGAANQVQQVVNGGVVDMGFTVAGNQITFTVAPLAGNALSWTGTYYYQVRFKSDQAEFSQFLDAYWETKALTLRTFF